jgi:hypothetical protein
METKPGIIGTAITVGSGLTGWLVEYEPVFRSLSFLVSVIAGVLTIAWALRKWYFELSKKHKRKNNP